MTSSIRQLDQAVRQDRGQAEFFIGQKIDLMGQVVIRGIPFGHVGNGWCEMSLHSPCISLSRFR